MLAGCGAGQEPSHRSGHARQSRGPPVQHQGARLHQLPRSCRRGKGSARLCAQGFSLRQLKHLVLDEADRLLHMDFEQEIDQILKVIPKVRPCEGVNLTRTLCLWHICSHELEDAYTRAHSS